MSIKKTGVDQQLIRDLAGILNDTNLTEIEVELGELKVRVSHARRRRCRPMRPRPRSPRSRRLPATPTAAPRKRRRRRPGAQCRHLADGRHRLSVALARREGRSSRSARRCARARRCSSSKR